jgi:hypothetical protein
MRTLSIDWADLEIAFRDATGGESYLDKETGEAITIVKGFDDEAELRNKVRRSPDRYLLLPPVDAGFSKAVLHAFVARLPAGSLRTALADAENGAGGFARSMQLLRADKAAFASFSRFEQGELLKNMQQFLRAHDVEPDSEPPDVELFD